MPSKLALTCSSCIFFERQKLDDKVAGSKQTLHKNMGYKPYSKACSHYEPDPYPLATQLPLLEMLSVVVNGLPANRRQNLAALIARSEWIEKHGYKFMQKVAFQWRGERSAEGHYCNNFLTGHVFDITNDGRYVRVVSKTGSLETELLRSSLMKMDKFYRLQKRLKAANRIFDPRYPRKFEPLGRVKDPEVASTPLTLEHVKDRLTPRSAIKVKPGPKRFIDALERELAEETPASKRSKTKRGTVKTFRAAIT